MHALFDTIRNITLLKRKLAEQLGLNIEEYTSTFQVTSGANVHNVVKLPRKKF